MGDELEIFSAGEELEDVEHNGEVVTLNKPFATPDKDKKYAVYARNSAGDVVKVRFSGEPVTVESSDPSTPSYWSGKKGALSSDFAHKVFFDMASKRIRSCRDGVQEYYGVELGIEPSHKVFTVYRSPETLSEMASRMLHIPIIDDHSYDPGEECPDELSIGTLGTTEIVEFSDESSSSTLYLEHNAILSDRAMALKGEGKREFSLAGTHKTKEHAVYDFEWYDINPTHLALVDSARGGSVLTFVDKRKEDMPGKLATVFCDAEGNPNLEQIVEIAQGLPEALRKVPMDKLQEVMPMLQEIVSMSKAGGSTEPEMADADMDGDTDGDMEDGDTVSMNESYEDMEGEEKEKFGDSVLYKSIAALFQDSFADSQAFQDAVAGAVTKHSEVIEKAKTFVADDYSFADKSTKQIMIDAIAVEHADTTFEDAELDTAFKMLKKSNSSLETFGDSKKDELEQLANEEL
ncbi:hypothetical protein NVP1052A_05 [Vibrio phage 1.052.A._10N.286.46.C3]|nr:hypothetical protein NVP1052A_05 [Vibrio phage 1.052.A._10N.286.46.C3]